MWRDRLNRQWSRVKRQYIPSVWSRRQNAYIPLGLGMITYALFGWRLSPWLEVGGAYFIVAALIGVYTQYMVAKLNAHRRRQDG